MNFRLFAHGDEVSTPVAKMLQGCDDVRIVKSESEDRTMPRVGLFTDVVFPVSKAARKAEVPPGVISGDPVLSPTLDEDDDDAKSAARKIRHMRRTSTRATTTMRIPRSGS